MQRLLFFLFLTYCSACSAPERPQGVLTQAQLAALLTDVYLGEARVESVPAPKDSTIRYFIPFEQKLLLAKGIPDSTLKKTYSYYLAHPKELEQVYDAVIDTLVLRDQRIKKFPIP